MAGPGGLCGLLSSCWVGALRGLSSRVDVFLFPVNALRDSAAKDAPSSLLPAPHRSGFLAIFTRKYPPCRHVWVENSFNFLCVCSSPVLILLSQMFFQGDWMPVLLKF